MYFITVHILFVLLTCHVISCTCGSEEGVKDYDYLDESDDEYTDELDSANPRYSSNKINLIKCRQFHHARKVIRGRNAKPKEYPHMAALGYGEPGNIHWNCGGSLISRKFVLTAAHCLYSQIWGPVKVVRLGEMDLNSTTDDADPKDFAVKATHLYPNYKSAVRYHDIALIQLQGKVNFTKHILPACLAVTSQLNGTNPVVAGWGFTRRGGNPANILQTAPMQYVSRAKCSKTYRPSIRLKKGIIDEIHICAGGGTNKTDTCQGDSGGPLQIINTSYKFGSFPEIVGITSFGKSCGDVASVYTRVYPYVEWIEGKVWPRSQKLKLKSGLDVDEDSIII